MPTKRCVARDKHSFGKEMEAGVSRYAAEAELRDVLDEHPN